MTTPHQHAPHLGGLELPPPGPLRRKAWAELGEHYARRSLVWPGLVLEDGASHVTLKALERVEGRIRRVLSIKANPPTYRGIVGDLGGALGAAWGVSEPLVLEAAEDVARIGSKQGKGKTGQARVKARIDRLQTDLAAAGKAVTRGPLAATYTRYLGASFALGQTETTKPLGWIAGFSLVDQDAIAGLSNSGLFWVGEHYGKALDSGKLLGAAQRMIESGMGREQGGKFLREAFGAEFQRSDSYWKGLASTVATRARTFGALSGMEATGATTYSYVNPLDERTSEVCRKLDGVIFTVKGGTELRDRLAGADPATSPEDWKAIAPWPKPADLDGPDGALLTPGELQAKGVAWPPLHFHCRSSIDVETWAEIRPSDLDGPGNVERAGPRPAPKPKAKPRAKPRPSRAKPKPTATPWEQAKANLKASEDRARALGLDPELSGLSDATATELEAMIREVKTARDRPKLTRWGNDPPHAWEQLGGGRVSARKAPTYQLEGYLELLEGTGADTSYASGIDSMIRGFDTKIAAGYANAEAEKRAFLEVVKGARGYYKRPDLARKVRAELEALREVQTAYRAALEHAPREVREAWRAKLNAQIMDGVLPRSWPAAKRQAVEAAIGDALEVYPEDMLRLWKLERGSLVHEGANGRAFARGGTYGPSTHMNLAQLARQEGGRWVPLTKGHSFGTISHELGHNFDSILGKGPTGARWIARADYPEASRWWDDSIGGTFKAQWDLTKSGPNRGRPKIVKMRVPWTEKSSKYQMSGDYVNPYEARIYAGGRSKPTWAQIGEFGGPTGGGGPVEFTAMAVQYTGSAAQQTTNMMIARTSSNNMARRYLDALTRWPTDGTTSGISSPTSWNPLSRARALYKTGNLYRDGLEEMTQAGFRNIRRLADAGSLAFKGDADVQAFALMVRNVHGTDLGKLMGPGGPLSPYLSAPLEPAHLAKLNQAAKALDGFEAGDLADLHQEFKNMTRSPASFDRTIGDLASLAED